MESSTVVHGGLLSVQSFLETWGWPILISLACLYAAWPYILKYRAHRIRVEAQNPERVTLLEADMRRSRVKQGLEYYKRNFESKSQ